MRPYNREFQYQEVQIVKSVELDEISDYKYVHLHLHLTHMLLIDSVWLGYKCAFLTRKHLLYSAFIRNNSNV